MFLTARRVPGQRQEAEAGGRAGSLSDKVRAEPGRSMDTEDRRSYGPGSDWYPCSQVSAGEMWAPWEVTAAGQAEIFDAFLCKLSPAQLLQCCLWLYASLPPAAAQGLARRCPQGILPLPRYPSIPSYLSVPFCHGAVHREGKDWKEEDREIESEGLLTGLFLHTKESPVLPYWGGGGGHSHSPSQYSLLHQCPKPK